MATQRKAGLEDEEVFKDQSTLCRRGKRVEGINRGAGVGKVRLPQRITPGGPLLLRQNVGRDRIESVRRHLRQRLPDKASLHVWRHTTGAFVDGHNATGVQGVEFFAPGSRIPDPVWAFLDDLELRIGDLQSARAPEFHLAEQHHALVRADNVLQKGLVGPHHLNLAAGILHEGLEQPEPGTARVRQPRVQHFPADRRGHARAQRDDRLQAAAVFVAARKAEQEIFDRVQAGLLQVGGLARTDPLEELQGQLEDVLGHGHYCTTVKRPLVTSMRRISAGSSNVSSMDEPPGLSAVRVK